MWRPAFIFSIILALLIEFSFGQSALVDSMEGALEDAPLDTTRVRLLVNLGFEVLTSDPEQTIEYGREALTLAKKLKFTEGEALAYSRISQGLKAQGFLDSAMHYIQMNLAIRYRQGNQTGIAYTLWNIGNIYKDRSVYDSASIYYLQALQLGETIDNKEIIAGTLNGLGIVNRNMGNIDKAIGYYAKGLVIQEQRENLRGIATASMNLGICWDTKKNYTLSAEYFEKARGIFEQTNDQAGLALYYDNFSASMQGQGKYTDAVAPQLNGYRIYEEMGNQKGIGTASASLANIYFHLGQFQEAHKYCEQALTYAIETGSVGDQQKAYEFLHQISANSGNYQTAYNYLTLARILSDSIFNINKTLIIEDLQTKYETEKKEQLITLQNQQLRNKELMKNIFLGGSIALLLALAALTFIYVQRQRLARQHELISQQKIDELLKTQEIKTYNAMIEGQEEERKRIAIDLHDRLGSMLATVKMHFSSLEQRIDQHQLQADQQYSKAHLLLDQAVDEVRRISHNLSTGMVVSFGLEAALKELCESIESTGKLQTKVLVYGLRGRLDNQIEITIYRIIQEVISNILKHAQAKHLTIQINKSDDTLNVTVEDDGIGFNVEERMKTSGMGLKNMIARAEKLNAQFHIDSSPGKGSIAVLEIPLLPEGPHPID